MREFKVKRLLIIIAVIVGVFSFVSIPYYIGVWCGYKVTPDMATAIPSPTDNGTIYYSQLMSRTTPIDIWFQGFWRIIAVIFGLFVLGCICATLYSLYDWVFPKKPTATQDK